MVIVVWTRSQLFVQEPFESTIKNAKSWLDQGLERNRKSGRIEESSRSILPTMLFNTLGKLLPPRSQGPVGQHKRQAGA
jgi:hypothetical protein